MSHPRNGGRDQRGFIRIVSRHVVVIKKITHRNKRETDQREQHPVATPNERYMQVLETIFDVSIWRYRYKYYLTQSCVYSIMYITKILILRGAQAIISVCEIIVSPLNRHILLGAVRFRRKVTFHKK